MTSAPTPPVLVFIVGPPAVGKMTVGHALAARTGLRLFHAASDLPGLIFTYVWAFDDPTDTEVVEKYAGIFRRRGGSVLFAELEAAHEERLRRNETEFRLAEKPFMRDLAASRRRLAQADASYQLNSHGVFDERPDYFRLDTTALTAEETAERIVARFGLTRSADPIPST